MIPELGAFLGRLLHPPRADTAVCPGLDRIRAELLTALFERAGGARRLESAGDAAGARAALGPGAWLEAWEPAVVESARAVHAEIVRRLTAAGAVSRLPRRRLRASLPDAEDHRVLQARLSAAGIPFEAAVGRIGSGDGDWSEEIRRAAGALEESWSELVGVVREELGVWEGRVALLRSWRRPWTPLVVATTSGLMLATLAGLVFGGYLPAPAWFRPVAEWVWSLGWP